MQKLTEQESDDLWLRLRKEDNLFEDLCDAHDAVVRAMEVHSLSLDGLELKKQEWKNKLEKYFKKAITEEIKSKSKKSKLRDY